MTNAEKRCIFICHSSFVIVFAVERRWSFRVEEVVKV